MQHGLQRAFPDESTQALSSAPNRFRFQDGSGFEIQNQCAKAVCHGPAQRDRQ
jgi:hypothetical protein